MTARWLVTSAAFALTSAVVLAQDSPEDLLPPGFDDPAPKATATPTPRQTRSAGQQPTATATSAGDIVQPLPSQSAPAAVEYDLSRLPTIEQLEKMSTDELDDLLGLKPKYDIPPAARRSMAMVGVIGPDEGGLPPASLGKQPAALVRAVLAGAKGPMVSRWGHILVRRALASRLAGPEGMDPVEFATLRARTLNGLGEYAVTRALVQDVDTGNYDAALADAAIDAYVGTSDITGACPAVRLVRTDRDDPQWKMFAGICNAFAGEETRAQNDLRRLLNQTSEDRIDVLFAQRMAGAAGSGRKAVTIEWDGVNGLTPWRFALANALGEPVPEGLLEKADARLLSSAAITPALPVVDRARGAEYAAARGILSSAAMVDLYAQVFAQQLTEGDAATTASRLREAYVGAAPADRMAAIRDVWGQDPAQAYGRMVITAYAAARMPADDAFEDDAANLIASMLTAGLDGDAMRWSAAVEDGSVAWALLALANPRGTTIANGDVDSFLDDDPSPGQRKSRMLVAGLAGLGRLGSGDATSFGKRLGFDLGSQTRWTRMIDRAAQVDNKVMVVLLAGLGMQGSSWDAMTARHLYHIVSALKRVGLEAEARMIAAEAVARA